jgi:hypothetical protein
MTKSHRPITIRTAAAISLFVTILWMGLGIYHPFLLMSENQNLYIFSTAAQVLAAIYGLTLTGYVFLRNQQDRESDKDESLVEIFADIQDQQYQFVAFISAIAAAAILLCLLAIATTEMAQVTYEAYTSNGASSLFVLSLGWTTYFVVDAIRPGKIGAASADIKGEVASQEAPPSDLGAPPVVQVKPQVAVPNTEAPSLTAILAPAAEESVESSSASRTHLGEFMTNFNSIKQALEEYARRYLDTEPSAAATGPAGEPIPHHVRRNWSKPRILKALESEEIIPAGLVQELAQLIRYRNALINGDDMNVDSRIIKRVQAARLRLAEAFAQAGI